MQASTPDTTPFALEKKGNGKRMNVKDQKEKESKIAKKNHGNWTARP